ncbi:MAG: PQQ-binding-like beta-propeller repeat protein [Ktedonobacteraceae bacterium]
MKKLFLVCTFLSLISLCAGCGDQPPAVRQPTVATATLITPNLYDQDWTGLYGMDSRNGNVLWQNPAFRLPAQVVVSGTTVYMDNGYELSALDAHRGSVLWNNMYQSQPRTQDTTLVVGQSGVYIITNSASVAAVNWTYGEGYGNGNPAPDPAASAGSTILSFDPSTGHLRRKQTLSFFLAVPLIDGDTIYGIGVQGTHGTLYALKGSDGSVLWQQPLLGESLYDSLLTVAGVLYFVRNGLSGYTLSAFSLRDGQQIWHTKQMVIGSESSHLTFDGGMLYFVVDPDQLYAFKASDGTLAWTRTFPGMVSLFPGETNNGIIPATDGHVYLVSQSTDASPLHILALDGSTGATIWSQVAPQSARVFQVLIASHDYLYLGAAEDNVSQVSIFVFNTMTGKLSMRYATPAESGAPDNFNFTLVA